MDSPSTSSQENVPKRDNNEIMEDDSMDTTNPDVAMTGPDGNIKNEREPLREVPPFENAVQFNKKVYQKKQVEDYANNVSFVDNNYPSATFKPVERKFLNIETIAGSDHSKGWFLPDADVKCVICFEKQDSDGNDELIQCHGCMSGEMEGQERIAELNKQEIEAYEASKKANSSARGPPIMKPKLRNIPDRPCRSKFHMSCIMKYNAGSFFFQYAARLECQAKFLCPLHCCNKCNLAHQKQSAYAPGLTECALCLRAFHLDTCYPAGARDHYVTMEVGEKEKKKKIKFELIICPAHYEEEEEMANKAKRKSLPPTGVIKTGKIDRPIREHLRGCCNVACVFDTNENLINCRTCVRAFHRECCEVQTIDGEIVPEDQCESCICGDEIPLNVLVLSLWEGTKGFWLGKTVSWYKFPTSARKNAKFEKLGYTVVEWLSPEPSKTPVMSIVPINTIAPLIESYSALAPPKYKKFWKDSFTEQNEQGFASHPSVAKKAYASVKTSKYSNNNIKQKGSLTDGDVCNCEGGIPNRCTEDSDCISVATNYECPPSCTDGGKICNNRKISTAYINPKIELLETTFKGIGVFAKEDIANGEFLAEYAGDIIDKEEKKRRLDVISKSRDFQANHYMLDLVHGKTIDAAIRGNISRYMNHSCEPNSGVFQMSIPLNKQGTYYDTRGYVKTIKNIKKGDEITFCYEMDDLDNLPVCRCESVNCTGTMGKSAAKVREEQERKEANKRRAMNNNKAKNSKKVQPKKQASGVNVVQNITRQPDLQSPSNQLIRQQPFRSSLHNRVVSKTITTPNPVSPPPRSASPKRLSSVEVRTPRMTLKRTASPPASSAGENLFNAAAPPASRQTPAGRRTPKTTVSPSSRQHPANLRGPKNNTPVSMKSTPRKRQNETESQSTPNKKTAVQSSPRLSISAQELDDSFSPGRMERVIPNQSKEETSSSEKITGPILRECPRNRRSKKGK
ncbi:hypothetical protein GCK72_018575 [Caenorhabditis remanei]|uniref:Uncharacterized protein n=1 Tax=Caenorhabditis remanei TaxID=31234 RepID=A0A6A5GB82_CAERE|nr:hypothetical protein GCK72_018575 [Caenorhabditis remanei]KAF1752021.1 hypothetical protein GCK72_018575 [Caenorhabditis remanei]